MIAAETGNDGVAEFIRRLVFNTLITEKKNLPLSRELIDTIEKHVKTVPIAQM